MTPEKRNVFLKEVYDFQVVGGKDSALINKNDNPEYRENLAIIEYWADKGLLEKIATAVGFIVIKLTTDGIDFVEGNLK